jgi:hypothetical protein
MKNIIINNQDMIGTLWMVGWLFSIGYLKLTFWKGVLGLIVWPYYIGKKFSKETKVAEL